MLIYREKSMDFTRKYLSVSYLYLKLFVTFFQQIQYNRFGLKN